ncbi:hypothetical protein Tco_0070571, partial [Tanacetum coccineum]
SLMEEIDIFLDGDDSIPPGIESDDFDSEDSTIDVVEDIPVDVPNILPTHLALQLDFNSIPTLNDLGSDLDVFSPSGDRNKIYDLGICIEVESTRFLATIAPDFEASRARGFVLRSLELQSSASLWESNIQSYRLTFIFMHRDPF